MDTEEGGSLKRGGEGCTQDFFGRRSSTVLNPFPGQLYASPDATVKFLELLTQE